jgi:hypothetical protein
MYPSKCFSRVLTCMVCLFAFLSCQKTDSVRNVLIDENVKVTPRQDCSNCDCSCFVELKSGSAASLALCGTCEGPTANCMGDDTCDLGPFSSGGHTISLTSALNPRHSFCEEFTSPFWVENTSTTDVAHITISCTANSGIPQTITLTLQPTQRVYIQTDNSCEIEECT